MSAVVFMANDAEAFLRRLWALDDQLVAAGFHPVSDWWRALLTRFVLALPDGVRRAVIRAGRRAGKSSTICRLCVAWALWGAWSVPTGDVAVIAFLSVSRDEASARLRTIAAILDVLKIRYELIDGEIEIHTERGPVLFKVYAAHSRSVGFTGIALVGDEVARWESRDTAANPAAEVFASLFPTLASQPFGFAFLVSSPWGSDDYHATRFDEGDTNAQIVAHGATWECNPSITEERTHELEPDPRIWSREYAGEPGATVTSAIDPVDVAACFRDAPPDIAAWHVPIDASSLRGDSFTWLRVGVTPAGELVVASADGFDGDALRDVSMRDVVQAIASDAQACGAGVLGDQRESAALETMFAEEQVTFTSYAWSEPSKDRAMQLLRRLMRERRVFICDHARLRAQLIGLKARLLPSGRISYATSGVDYASALITLMHAIDVGDVSIDVREAPAVIVPERGGGRWADYSEEFGSRGFG